MTGTTVVIRIRNYISFQYLEKKCVYN